MKNKDKIKVKCKHCGEIEELNGLSGWSFIIMKEHTCLKCKKKTPYCEAQEKEVN